MSKSRQGQQGEERKNSENPDCAHDKPSELSPKTPRAGAVPACVHAAKKLVERSIFVDTRGLPLLLHYNILKIQIFIAMLTSLTALHPENVPLRTAKLAREKET